MWNKLYLLQILKDRLVQYSKSEPYRSLLEVPLWLDCHFGSVPCNLLDAFCSSHRIIIYLTYRSSYSVQYIFTWTLELLAVDVYLLCYDWRVDYDQPIMDLPMDQCRAWLWHGRVPKFRLGSCVLLASQLHFRSSLHVHEKARYRCRSKHESFHLWLVDLSFWFCYHVGPRQLWGIDLWLVHH